jgi:methylated-DNA-[protein]-cysteine S-methyltransferase
MPVIINWVELQSQASDYVQIALAEESLAIYYFNDVITKTEWSLTALDKKFVENNDWKEIQHYLNNPAEILKVNLKKQGSAFRHRVWVEMCKIPVGQTLTYSALARRINSGARAVANACRDNPFPVIIPCHRVVAVSGLGGYMGQTEGRAMEIKKKLLAIERHLKGSD